jgi:hypothetical protein
MEVIFVVADSNSLSQPYILSLFDELVRRFQVRLVIPSNVTGRAGVLEKSPLRVSRTRSSALRDWIVSAKLWIKGLGLSRLVPFSFQREIASSVIGETAAIVSEYPQAVVVAVEYPAMLACQLAGIRAHFVSLELLHQNAEALFVDHSIVRSCLTQSWLRYLALFPSGLAKCFIVPNFPTRPIDGFQLRPRRGGCVLPGSAFPGFGLHCISDYLLKYPESATFMGGGQHDLRQCLIDRGFTSVDLARVTMESKFLPESEFISRISEHDFAFSIYDLRYADRTFFAPNVGLKPWSMQNYITGFPGKIGMCMNAGVPVISSRFPGTAFVEEYGVGVAVNDLSPDALRTARNEILSQGQEMRSRCIDLASKFSFRDCVASYLDFVHEDN